MLKVEAVTKRKGDIIGLCDMRLGRSGEYIRRLFKLSLNGEYDLYYNSTKDSRGVGIAIRTDSGIKAGREWKDDEENWLLKEVDIGRKKIIIGVIYGPNGNDINFFNRLKGKLHEIGMEFILGGDFNTILDRRNNGYNIDREGVGNIPNIQNSEIINEGIEDGVWADPFRNLYPHVREYSYIPFNRERVIVKNRLDFSLVSAGMIQEIYDVEYGDILGKDFDHRELIIKLGRKETVGKKERIYNNTLNEKDLNKLMVMVYYETLNNHKREIEQEIINMVSELDGCIREVELLEIKEGTIGLTDQERVRKREREDRGDEIMRYLQGRGDMLDEEYECDFRTLYEITIMAMKGKLLGRQVRNEREKGKAKKDVLDRREVIAQLFGRESEEYRRINTELEEIMDKELKERAGKFKIFFESNNEKPTRAFYKIGKQKKLNDSTNRIRDKNGEIFRSDEERKEYVGNTFEKLYKKRIDRLIEIENYLEEEGDGGRRKLSEGERISLEGEITMEEIEAALKESNMDSASGWDGVSYYMLSKIWSLIRGLLTKCARECFEHGRLSNTFRTGIIRLIPKKKESDKIEDWRPITLLSCSYKIISGVVAKRLEKYLDKIIGRGQKGFLKYKNIHQCTMNVMDNISNSWEQGEGMATICVDFSKAFDSIEHMFIEKVLIFFNYGRNMINMVMTILRDREGMVILDGGYSKRFKIERGTPQGDRSSPYIFILCIEILILRLEKRGGTRNGVGI
jgi:exonuclease III